MSLINVKKKEALEKITLSLPASSIKSLKEYAQFIGSDNLGEVLSEIVKYVTSRDKDFKKINGN